MKAAVVEKAKAEKFVIKEKNIPEPADNQVRIKVHACGVCHSDMFTKDAVFPGIQYPISPGHEVAGVIDKVGAGVLEWKAGDRVGVGWHGGHCFQCENCRRGDFITCKNQKVCGSITAEDMATILQHPSKPLLASPTSCHSKKRLR